MTDLRLTRVRVEGKAREKVDLPLFLSTQAAKIRDMYGGEWEEEPVQQVMETSDGQWWGSYTIRRKDGT